MTRLRHHTPLALCALALAPPGSSRERPPAACFAEGTPWEYVERVQKEQLDPLARTSLSAPAEDFQFTDGNRWSRTATNPTTLVQGDPTTITWSVVPDGTPITRQYTGESTAGSSLRAASTPSTAARACGGRSCSRSSTAGGR